MSVQLKSIVKPSQFNLTGPFMGSPLHQSEKEVVARNIVIISRENGDAWTDFTFEDYKRLCRRDDCRGEEFILNELAEKNRILDKNGDTYSVNERFFRVLAQFIL